MNNLACWCKDLFQRKSRCHPTQQEGHSTGSQSLLLELPLDLLEMMLGFLTGFDLLPLSHSSRQLYHGLLSGDAEIWQRLARSPLPPLPARTPSSRYALSQRFLRWCHPDEAPSAPSAKQRYFARRSIHFRGGSYPGRGGAIPTPTVEAIACDGSFSFDLVFALLPERESSLLPTERGIVLGVDSARMTGGFGGLFSAKYMSVDSDRNLFCSVMSDKSIVVKRLAFEHWYHVALVFEVTGPGPATQHVYLDGVLVHTAQGCLDPLSSNLFPVRHPTGGLDPRAPVCGWRAFNGLVDECRFWNRVLSLEEIRRLASNGSLDTAAHAANVWSMRRAAAQSGRGAVHIVRSTSPAERTVCNLKVTHDLPTHAVPPIRFDRPRDFSGRERLAHCEFEPRGEQATDP